MSAHYICGNWIFGADLSQCLVYQVTNSVNGKRYIGYTSQSLSERWRGHVKSSRIGSKSHFHLAIKKHGQDSFKSEVLFVEDSLAGAKETEILLILDHCPEYNKTMGGDGTTGHLVTDEAREKIRQNTPVRSGKDHPMYGRKRPDTAEMNRSRKGIKNPKLAQFGEDNPNFGKPRSEETKLKISEGNKGKIVSEETKSMQSASAKKRSQTEEGKRNSSLAGKKGAAARWAKHRAEKLAKE